MSRLLILLLLLLIPGGRAALAVDVPTTATLRLVRFQGGGGLQFDVWIDGKPAGVTPFTSNLAPGRHLLTAVAEGIEPFIEEYQVTDTDGQVALLPVVPLAADNYFPVRERVFRELKGNPDNPHLLMIALLLATRLDERETLLGQLAALKVNHPLAQGLRARFLADAGRAGEGLKPAEDCLRQWGSTGFAWRTLAIVQLARGEYEPALDAANQAAIFEPNAWRNLRVRASIHSQLNDMNAAHLDSTRADEIFAEFQKRAAEKRP